MWTTSVSILVFLGLSLLDLLGPMYGTDTPTDVHHRLRGRGIISLGFKLQSDLCLLQALVQYVVVHSESIKTHHFKSIKMGT